MQTESTAEQDAREALALRPFPQTPWVKVADEGIIIVTGYSEALNRLLRWMPKAKWRANQRSWLVPFSSAEAVRAVLPEIIRLADAAQELDEPAARDGEAGPAIGAADRLETSFAEAAKLLFGADWRTSLAREFNDSSLADGRSPEPDNPVFAEVVMRLRRKAQALEQAAVRLEKNLRLARGA